MAPLFGGAKLRAENGGRCQREPSSHHCTSLVSFTESHERAAMLLGIDDGLPLSLLVGASKPQRLLLVVEEERPHAVAAGQLAVSKYISCGGVYGGHRFSFSGLRESLSDCAYSVARTTSMMAR